MIRTVAFRALLAAALVVTIPTATTAQEEGLAPEGMTWYLTAYDAGGLEPTPVPWDLGATLTLDPDRALAFGYAGCQGFAASYEIDDKALTFSRVGPNTAVGCSDEAGAIEAAYLAALAKTVRWAIDTGPAPGLGGLILFDADGEHLLYFDSSSTALLGYQVRQLTEMVEAQEQVIRNLRARIKELEEGG